MTMYNQPLGIVPAIAPLDEAAWWAVIARTEAAIADRQKWGDCPAFVTREEFPRPLPVADKLVEA